MEKALLEAKQAWFIFLLGLILLGYEAALKRHKPTAPFLLVASDGTVHYNDVFAHLAHFEVMDGDVSE